MLALLESNDPWLWFISGGDMLQRRRLTFRLILFFWHAIETRHRAWAWQGSLCASQDPSHALFPSAQVTPVAHALSMRLFASHAPNAPHHSTAPPLHCGPSGPSGPWSLVFGLWSPLVASMGAHAGTLQTTVLPCSQAWCHREHLCRPRFGGVLCSVSQSWAPLIQNLWERCTAETASTFAHCQRKSKTIRILHTVLAVLCKRLSRFVGRVSPCSAIHSPLYL